MDVSIIIINYNTFQLTCNCIQSIYQKVNGLSFEIVLVDNASVECDASLFLQKFPDVKLIKSATNTGFTGGNNIGISHANGNFILLLNSDTELLSNAPKICIDYLKANTIAALATAQLQYPSGKLQYNCRRFRTITWELLEVFPFFKLLPKKKQEELMLHHYFTHDRTMNCDWVWGTFMMFKKELLMELPQKKLSNDFFMYCEDVLWCLEIKQLGYDIVFLPEAKVMHIHKGSSSPDKLLAITKMTIKNHSQLMKKYYTDFRWYIFALIYKTKQYGFLLWKKIVG